MKKIELKLYELLDQGEEERVLDLLSLIIYYGVMFNKAHENTTNTILFKNGSEIVFKRP